MWPSALLSSVVGRLQSHRTGARKGQYTVLVISTCNECLAARLIYLAIPSPLQNCELTTVASEPPSVRLSDSMRVHAQIQPAVTTFFFNQIPQKNNSTVNKMQKFQRCKIHNK